MAERRGAFVTLHHQRRLRGCVGRVVVLDPLFAVVAECAATAATADPRFAPFKQEELQDLEIEISVLSAPRQVSAEEVQPGIHGLVVSHGRRRGVLLPQVAAERGWSRDHFLEQTCCKAGLDANAWKEAETRIEVFTAEVFSETELRAAQENDAEVSKVGRYSSSQ